MAAGIARRVNDSCRMRESFVKGRGSGDRKITLAPRAFRLDAAHAERVRRVAATAAGANGTAGSRTAASATAAATRPT